ncbi:hypothetical protein ACIBTP_08775 [Streptomyces avidinii]|uniref:hypothetical protein n=1 Tax=Streptomyces avidinii TaxID=1895 RepID=UPI0037A9CFFF
MLLRKPAPAGTAVHGRPFPGHTSTQARTDPKPIEHFDDFASDDFASDDFASDDFASDDFAVDEVLRPLDTAAPADGAPSTREDQA